MAYLYSDVVNNLQNLLQNDFGSVPQQRVLVNTAMREMFMEIDIHSSIRRSQGVDTLYDSIFRYPLPTDAKTDGIIDIQKTKHYLDASAIEYSKVPLEEFNRFFDSNTYTIDFHNADRWLVINDSDNNNAKIALHTMNSVTDNGTWSVADSGTNIGTNTSNYVSGTASISVDTSSTSISIENSTLTAVDLSLLEDKGKIFVWVYLPEITNVTGCTLLWGSDSSNYWSDTVTTPHNFTAFHIGWNLLAFDWNGATETLSPAASAIDYLKLTITISSAPTITTGYLVDNIVAGLGEAAEFKYYSSYPWRTTAANWIENSTANTDILNVDTEEFQLALYKICIHCSQAISLSTEDMNYFTQMYDKLKKRYTERYPSQSQKIISEYYRI